MAISLMTLGNPLLVKAAIVPNSIGSLNSGATTGTNFSLSTTADSPAGQMILVTAWVHGNPSNITIGPDSAGNNYAKLYDVFNVSGHQVVWYCANPIDLPSGGAIPIQWSATAQYLAMAGTTVSGVSILSPADTVGATATATSPTISAVSNTLSVPDEIVFGLTTIDYGSPSDIFIQIGSFTDLIDNSATKVNRPELHLGYKVVSSASQSTYAATITSKLWTAKTFSFSAVCPYDTTGAGGHAVADGCDGADATGNFVNPTFFNSMRQSGQGAYLATPLTAAIPQNVAGVTYPVGIPSTIFTGSVSGVTLTVNATLAGMLKVGMTLDEGHGGILQGTHLIAGSGAHWTLDKSQTVLPTTLYAQALSDVQSIGGATLNGTIVGTALTVNSVTAGALAAGRTLTCVGCGSGTMLVAGFGGAWTVSPSQSVGPVSMTVGSDPNMAVSECAYSATGNPTGAGPQVTCRNGPTTPVVINGYDFSPSDVEGKAVYLFINPAASVTVSNSKFVMDAGLNAIGGVSGYFGASSLVDMSFGSYNDNWTNNLFDGCAIIDSYCPSGFNNFQNVSGTYPSVLITSSKTGSTINTYNAFINVDGRDYSRAHNDLVGDQFITAFNYISGIVFGTNAPHGEFDLMGNTGGSEIALEDYQYNTFSEPVTANTGEDGLIVSGTTSSGSAIVSVAAGSLSPLVGQTSPRVVGAGIPAGDTVTAFNNGSWSAATQITLSGPSTLSGTAPLSIYGGTGSGNATTSPIAAWGQGAPNPLIIDDAEIVGNVFIINQAPLYGGSPSKCLAPGSATRGSCFPTAGAAMVTMIHNDTTATSNIIGNYFDPTGSYFAYNMTVVATTASFNGNQMTSPLGTIPLNVFIVDNVGGYGKIQGGSGVRVGSVSGSGPYIYTLSAPVGGGPVSAETIYYQTAAPNLSGNIDMISGSSCNQTQTSISLYTSSNNACGGEW